MSFYRTVLAAVAAVAIASPVFANDTASAAAANQPAQIADNSSATSGATTTSTTEQTKINLNKATAKELMTVKGLNASKARAIVAYRKKNGDFKSTDDLANVKGFKKMKADAIKNIAEQLTVE